MAIMKQNRAVFDSFPIACCEVAAKFLRQSQVIRRLYNVCFCKICRNQLLHLRYIF